MAPVASTALSRTASVLRAVRVAGRPRATATMSAPPMRTSAKKSAATWGSMSVIHAQLPRLTWRQKGSQVPISGQTTSWISIGDNSSQSSPSAVIR